MRLVEAAPSPWVRGGVALVLGVLLALAMPPYSWWPLAVVAVAGLALLCRNVSGGTGALVGAAFGFGFVLVCMWWLWIIVPGLQFAVAAAEVPFFALLGAGLALTSRLPGWPLWGACCWVAMELLRGRVPFGGLPWGRLGLSVVDTPIVAWARYLGEGGLTLAVALGSTLLAAALVGSRRRVALRVGAAALVLAGAVLLPTGLQGPPGRSVTVAVVQGDVPGSGLDAFSRPRVTLRNHVQATHRLATDVRSGRVARPDVVVWPENASDIDPFGDPEARARVQGAVDAVGVPVVVGAVTQGPEAASVQGSGIVWHPESGPGQRYAKRRLVPFGEWVPMRPALTALVPLLAEETPRDFTPGNRPGILDTGPVTLGAVMCFEVAYDAAIRDVTRPDVDLIAVQTNNAFYLGTGQLDQQWAITRLRAVESGRAVAVAATTGISGFIAPDGTVIERTTGRTQQVLVAEVPAGEGRTPGIRWGFWVEVVGSVVAAAAIGSRVRRPGGVRRG
ncbi:MAG: apolipoprotein N-acyltransferase [Nocardioidaceae bacterium]